MCHLREEQFVFICLTLYHDRHAIPELRDMLRDLTVKKTASVV
jgi:hypothetical protein